MWYHQRIPRRNFHNLKSQQVACLLDTTVVENSGYFKLWNKKGENFVTYTNTLSIPPAAHYTSGPLAGLTFSRPIEWDFSCDYALDSVVKSDYVLESKMHKWAFNEGVGSFQFDLNFFENEYFDAELDNLAVSVGKPVYFNVEMNGGKCSK